MNYVTLRKSGWSSISQSGFVLVVRLNTGMKNNKKPSCCSDSRSYCIRHINKASPQ